jgi:hypothetical protein
MSRAINLNVAQADVVSMCARHNVAISAIERLFDGGTRVVLTNADDTATIARAFKSSIIAGPARRISAFTRQR